MNSYIGVDYHFSRYFQLYDYFRYLVSKISNMVWGK